ncbi:MAG: alpha-L-fucosidase [Bryobacteraceae bacterium]|jgi:alpha-L-fucosidase
MNRRSFLTSSLAAAAALKESRAAAERVNHELPRREKTQPYIEDIPVPEYRWASDAAYERFRDIKYGVRLHYGLYSILGQPNESWPFLGMSFEDRQRYQSMYKTWNPQGFNADEWMDLFASCGMKMFAFTAKHHEGFCMYDTHTRVRSRVNWMAPGGPKMEACNLAYSIMETPFHRDIVKELCDAAHKRDIKIDLYFSHPDWYDTNFRPYGDHPLQTPSAGSMYMGSINPGDAKKKLGDRMVIVPDPTPAEVSRMVARHRAQLSELLTRYGTIDMMCLDINLGPQVWPQLRETLLHLRKIQPDVMLRDRGIGSYGDYYTPEGVVPGSKENTDMPWFVIYPLGRSFSYESVPSNYKGPQWVVRNLVDSVAKGGNFMVAIGPNGNGQFHPTAISQLKDVGEWLKLNGQGIYATRPRDGTLWSEGANIRYTRTKDKSTVYAFALQWPGDKLVLQTVKPAAGSEVRMLGSSEPLKWTATDTGVEIQIPSGMQEESRRPCRFAWCFQIRPAAA